MSHVFSRALVQDILAGAQAAPDAARTGLICGPDFQQGRVQWLPPEALADALLARFGNDGAHPRKKKSSKHASKGGGQQEGGERTRRALACSALRLVRAAAAAGHLMQPPPALTTPY